MAPFDVITIGGAVRDITFFSRQGRVFATPNNLTAQKMLAFEYGAKITTDEAYYNLGGGAANTAVALARLGFKTAAMVRLGHDEDAHDICRHFQKEKVATDFIQTDQQHHTGFSFILGLDKKDREHIAFVYRGANNQLAFPTPKTQSKLKTKWFYITSLSGEKWLTILRAASRFAKNKKRTIKLAWNPGTAQLQAGKKILAPFLALTDVLILNKDEAIELVLSGVKIGRRHPRHLNRPLYLLNILKEWGPRLVIITDGRKGAWLFDGHKILRQRTRKSKVIDTTGVGDAFGASFIGGLMATHGDPAQALRWGAINAAAVCREIGAHNGLLTEAQLRAKL